MENKSKVSKIPTIGLAAIIAVIGFTFALSLTGCGNGATDTQSGKTLVKIEVTAQPTKTQYNLGEELDTEGMVVTATYSDDSTVDVTGYTVSGYDKNTTGNQTITVTWQGAEAEFTVNVIDPDLETVETPEADPEAGTYYTAQSVTLTTDMADADIYYTTDGTIPTTESEQYTDEISIDKTTTLKAIAVKAGMNDSGVLTAEYIITIPAVNAVQPVISVQPQGGTYFGSGTLTVTASVTDGGTLTYQWYKNDSNSNEGGTAIGTASTNASYTLTELGTDWYYAVITNTIADNGDGGTKTAQTTSDAAEVTVLVQPAVAEWAKTVDGGGKAAQFLSVAKDAEGNVYAAGYIDGTGSTMSSPLTINFGDGVSAQGWMGGGSGDDNKIAVLVKYNSSGMAQWARASGNSHGSGSTVFNAVAVDADGNVYAAGYIYGNGTGHIQFGKWATSYIWGSESGETFLVKFDSSGNVLWAKQSRFNNNSPTNRGSRFNAVAVDADGNVYAAGYQIGNRIQDFGEGVSATGTNSNTYISAGNAVLVKYNSSDGTAQWAKTVSAGSNASRFLGVAVDASGGVYAAGYQSGNGEYTYGEGVSATGTYSDTTSDTNGNAVLVKYNSAGTAQWAKSVSAGSNASRFLGVAVDASGGVYAAGYQTNTGEYTYGADVSATGTNSYTSDSAAGNVVLVKYNSSDGTAQWAKSVSAGSRASRFLGVAVDASGSVYAAGYQTNTDEFTYGTGVSAQGTSTNVNGNVLLVKYDSSGTAQWAKTVSAGSSASRFLGVAVDASGGVYAAGYQTNTGEFTYGTGVSATGTTTGTNAVLVKYGN